MGSIAGLISSPLFATYGATKAAVCNGIESLNIELEMAGTENRILNVSPGSIKGTKFNGGTNDLSQTEALAQASIVCSSTAQAATIFLQTPFSLSSANTSANFVIILCGSYC